LVAIDDVEAAFRARMPALARKGGAVTKRQYGYDPRYYRDIGRLGGCASVAARKARMVAELEGAKPGEAQLVEPCAVTSEVSPVSVRPQLTLKDILVELDRPGPYVRNENNRPPSLADLQAERDFAHWVARIRQEDSDDDDERWDPWSKRQ
jgi:general stress protein YciG